MGSDVLRKKVLSNDPHRTRDDSGRYAEYILAEYRAYPEGTDPWDRDGRHDNIDPDLGKSRVIEDWYDDYR